MTKPRKPLRRTAWGLLIGGLAGLALMVGAGLIAQANGQPAGPGTEATWPDGETVALYRVPLQGSGDKGSTTYCRLIPDGEETRTNYGVKVHQRVTPDFSGDAVVTCDQEVVLLTGETALTVSEISRGPLITIPLLAFFLGIMFFVPRLTLALAKASNGRLFRR